jgi:hypothetical protein
MDSRRSVAELGLLVRKLPEGYLSMKQLNRLERLAVLSALREWSFYV